MTRDLEAQAFTLSLAFAAAIYACVWFAAPVVADYLEKPDFVLLLRVMALSLWLVPFNSVCGAILERDMRLVSLAAILAISGTAQAVIVLVLALAGFGVWALGAGVLLGSVMAAAVTWWQSGWRPCIALPGRETAELARFGLMVSLTSLIWFFYSNTDKAIIAAMLGPAVLGLYAMAFQLATLPVDKVTSSINKAAFAAYCRLQSDPDRMREWYLRLVTLIFSATAPVLIGAALVADDAIPLLLGEKWSGMVTPFQILAPAGTLMMIATTLPPLLNALGRPDIPLKYVVACTVVYPVAFLFAAKLNGLNGVCAVWLILYPVQTAGLICVARRTTGISLSMFVARLRPFMVALAAMTVAVVVVRWISADFSVGLRIALLALVGAVVYTGMVALLIGSTATMEAIKLLNDLVPGRLKR